MALPDEIWVNFNTPSWNVLKFPLSARNFTQVTRLSVRPNFHLTSSNPSNQITGLALKQITTSTFIIILQLDTRYFFSYRAVAQSGSQPPRYWGFSITHSTYHSRHDSSVRVISSLQGPLTSHDTQNRQMSTPPAEFEPTISVNERPRTYASDRGASGTGTRHHVSV
jgi:hypothetical protein